MATVQHHVPTSVRISDHRDRLWISPSIVVAILSAGAATWFLAGSAATIAPLPAEVTGFEYDQEATGGRAAQAGVTGPYFGHSGELYPAPTLPLSVLGFEYDREATGGRLASRGVTSGYLAHNPMLDPDN